MLKIEHTIREAISTLEKTVNNFKTAAGSAYREVAEFFAAQNKIGIPTTPICPETFSAQHVSQSVSLHPSAEKELKNTYQTKFAYLLGIDDNKIGKSGQNLYAMLLEVLNALDSQRLSPLAIIRFKETLDIYAKELTKAALGFTEDNHDTFSEKAKSPINLHDMDAKLKLLKEVLLAAEKKEIAWQTTVENNDPFISALEELALVIHIKEKIIS